jgi:hypothetical protein
MSETSTVTDTPTSTPTPSNDAPAAPVAAPSADPVAAAPDPAPAPPAAPAAEGVASEGTLLGGSDGKAAEASEGEDGGDQQAAPEGAPEAYDIKLTTEGGEEVPLNPVLLEEATGLFREMNLSNEQANKLAPLAMKLMESQQAAIEEQQVAALSEAKNQWLEQTKAHPDIGGGKLEESLHLAAKAMDALGFKEGHPFRGLLDASGLGNHPDMILTFTRLGGLIGEETTFANPDGAANQKTVGWSDLYKDGKE